MSAHNILSLVKFSNGAKGFAARSEDSSFGWQEVFDHDGERLVHDPGSFIVIRELGKYAACDEDGFWALIASA